MIRLLATFLFLALICGASDCQAQRTRGLFLRHAPTQLNPRSAAGHFPLQTSHYSQRRNPKISRILDGPTSYRNPAEVNARYIGGFHQSHFYNIGIPSGDIGIRGNAYHWRPY
jgi:hypothetical protein